MNGLQSFARMMTELTQGLPLALCIKGKKAKSVLAMDDHQKRRHLESTIMFFYYGGETDFVKNDCESVPCSSQNLERTLEEVVVNTVPGA